MKKIGIITITRGENYGNKLQNYAVQEVVKKIGYTPETIINSTKKGFESPIVSTRRKYTVKHIFKVIKVRIRNFLYIKNDSDGLIKSLSWFIKNKSNIEDIKSKRREAFNNFSKTFIKSSDFSISINEISIDKLSKYDFFTCGSDQVWNPYYPQTSFIDFLNFAPVKKRIAYAPSFGVNTVPESRKTIYKKWLNEIPNLSVREEQGAAIIKELTGRKAEVLVDPTLMLSKKEWLAIAKKPNVQIGERFILTYFLGNKTKKYSTFIQKVAKQYSCNIINLNDIHEVENYKVNPSGFLYLINNAFLVCTDSFHGMVLSIIFNKEFVAFDRIEDGQSMGSRVETLLNKFDLNNRHFKNIKTFKLDSKTNFENVKSVISMEQNKTHEYFSKIFDSNF